MVRHLGSTPAHGHLRLVGAPSGRSRRRRLLAYARGWLAALGPLAVALAARSRAALAVVSLAARRRTASLRLRRRPRREARVIPFQPRRRALPR